MFIKKYKSNEKENWNNTDELLMKKIKKIFRLKNFDIDFFDFNLEKQEERVYIRFSLKSFNYENPCLKDMFCISANLTEKICSLSIETRFNDNKNLYSVLKENSFLLNEKILKKIEINKKMKKHESYQTKELNIYKKDKITNKNELKKENKITLSTLLKEDSIQSFIDLKVACFSIGLRDYIESKEDNETLKRVFASNLNINMTELNEQIIIRNNKITKESKELIELNFMV